MVSVEAELNRLEGWIGRLVRLSETMARVLLADTPDEREHYLKELDKLVGEGKYKEGEK